MRCAPILAAGHAGRIDMTNKSCLMGISAVNAIKAARHTPSETPIDARARAEVFK
jgi:hypothetical protein